MGGAERSAGSFQWQYGNTWEWFHQTCALPLFFQKDIFFRRKRTRRGYTNDPLVPASDLCDKMAVILRLQGLAAEAHIHDIRTFFQNSFIPKGGVYIVGGSLREAFIAFTSERDASFARRKTGSFLKGEKVSLHISSLAEVEHKLKMHLNSKVQKQQVKTKEHRLRMKAKEQKVKMTTKEKTCLKMRKTVNMKILDERLHLKTKVEKLPVCATERLNWKMKEAKHIQMKRTGKCQTGEEKTSQSVLREKLKMKKEKSHRKLKEAINKPSPTWHGTEITQTSSGVSSPALHVHNHNSQDLQCDSPLLDPRLAKMQSLNADDQLFHSPPVETLDPNTAFLLGMCTVLQGLQSSGNGQTNGAELEVPTCDITPGVSDVQISPELTQDSSPSFVRLFGLPASTTKLDICNFFTGLKVEEAIVNVKLGRGHGCLVKFASPQDAAEALHFNNQTMGHICVEVRGASEKMWTSALHDCENRYNSRREASHSLPLRDNANSEQTQTSPLHKKRRFNSQMPQKRVSSPSTTEFIVMARNLPKTMTKTEAKELFQCPNIGQRNVLHLLDINGFRTDTIFLIFNSPEDFNYALNLNGCHVNSASIEVSSITKERMNEMMAKSCPRKPRSVMGVKLRSS